MLWVITVLGISADYTQERERHLLGMSRPVPPFSWRMIFPTCKLQWFDMFMLIFRLVITDR